MNPPPRLTKPNLREDALAISKLLQTYQIPLFKLAVKKDQWTEEDVRQPANNHNAASTQAQFEEKWRQSKKSLLKTLVFMFWRDLAVITVYQMVGELFCRFTLPLFFVKMLRYFKDVDAPTRDEALFNAGVMLALNMGFVFTSNQSYYHMQLLGYKIRTALYSMIYNKCLRLKQSTLKDYSAGKIVNLLTNDVKCFTTVTMSVTYLWLAPMHAVEVTCYLYYLFGIVGLISTSSYFLLIVFQIISHKLSKKYRQKASIKTDERIRYVNEIISGIQVIKLYAWEIPFAKTIATLRTAETKLIRKINTMRGSVAVLWFFNREWTMFISVLSMILLGIDVTSESVFMLAIYLTALSITTAFMFCLAIIETTTMLVSLKRIQTFLRTDEREDCREEELRPLKNKRISREGVDKDELEPLEVTVTPIIQNKPEKQASNGFELKPIKPTEPIKLSNVTCKFSPTDIDPALSDITLTIPKNQLTVIIGAVGSGKTTLLQLILNELEIIDGTCQINGTISYACQDPWLFNGTIKQNILFGKPFEQKRYDECIHVCALEDDLHSFPFGDMTFVGDKGVSLSGGQKARVNLARAVYSDANIYLLDDPLSAVDPHVSKFLFNECISKYLANKTVILTTHQMQHLDDVKHLVVMNDGMIELQGSFDEVFGCCERAQEHIRRASTQEREVVKAETVEVKSDEYESKKRDMDEKTTKASEFGAAFYKYFACAGHPSIGLLVLFFFLLGQASITAGIYFLAIWVDDEELRQRERSNETRFFQSVEIKIAGTLVVLTFITCAFRVWIHFFFSSKVSRNLHDSMLKNLMRARMSFFDRNPIGRILNRFSEDLGVVDENIATLIVLTAQSLLFTSGGILLVIFVNPFIVPLAIVIVGVIYLIHKYYILTSVKIKQVEALTRSPILSYVSSTVDGLATIRALNVQEKLIENFNGFLDVNLGTATMLVDATTTYAFVLLLSMFALTLSVTIGSILLRDTLKNNASEIGMAIAMLCQMAFGLQNLMMRITDLKNFFISFDRTLEYTQIDTEDVPGLENARQTWPECGHIQFNDVCLTYDEKSVLKNLTFSIAAGEKVGIVGRTGAGKSSLIASLFRLATIDGKILIDDVDTGKIPLRQLRESISIIPQSAVLFSGTIRSNLDPFGKYTDHEIWQALEFVNLKTLFHDLNTNICPQTSLSQGQKQLVCLARAILRKNKILVLDEATANVDYQTDEFIQKTIRRIFNDCTVLTIAHRLNTIMDSDKILVMHEGEMVEFDHAHILYEKRGYFWDMLHKVDQRTRYELLEAAKNSYNRTVSLQEEEEDEPDKNTPQSNQSKL